MRRRLGAALLVVMTSAALAEVPSNLVVDGVPEPAADVIAKVRPYLDFRTASFVDWHPQRAEALIRTRFAETAQLHLVKTPGGARRQLTFFDEAVSGGTFRPSDPNTIVFSRDTGGNEQYQLYRYDLGTGAVTLLTDGKSRNTFTTWSRDGKWLLFASTARTGNDTDIWMVDPSDPTSARLVLEVQGGGWYAIDVSRDGRTALLINEISANESELYALDLATKTKRLLSGRKEGVPVAHSKALFSRDDSEIFFTTDEGAEFAYLVRMRLSDGRREVVAKKEWDVDSFALSDDRTRLAYTTNENGVGVLHLHDVAANKAIAAPKLPYGTIAGTTWHRNNRLVGFTLTSAKSPSDVYAYDTADGKLTRWTESETGGLNPERNAEPQLVTMKSFDGTRISAFVYRPDPARFPGKRPVLLSIHGGPEGQSRATFLGRSNYYINELGIAMVYPNVRGSTGYGKTYLAMDNGFKREDSVRDLGAILDWIEKEPGLDASRVAVSGGSYGGYMVLAAMTHFNDRLRAGIDVVGISSFLTFLKNTSGYRRDLRRVEYGDERDEKMRAHLEAISPLTNVGKIKKPLFVIMGYNDPRVPYTEGEQIVKAVRSTGAPVWYLMAKDEGHGFAKRKNQDYQMYTTVMFLEQHLLR